MTERHRKLGATEEFTAEVGRFYGIWATTELYIDLAITRTLGLSSEEGHLITSGLEFNRKARLLHELVKRRSPPNSNDIISCLNFFQNQGMRNVFAHSYLSGSTTHVEFIERSRHGVYNPKAHRFTMVEFADHVERVYEQGVKFIEALGFTEEDLSEFGHIPFAQET